MRKFAAYHAKTNSFYTGDSRPLGELLLQNWFRTMGGGHFPQKIGEEQNFIRNFHQWIRSNKVEISEADFEQNMSFLMGCSVVWMGRNNKILETVELAMFVLPELKK